MVEPKVIIAKVSREINFLKQNPRIKHSKKLIGAIKRQLASIWQPQQNHFGQVVMLEFTLLDLEKDLELVGQNEYVENIMMFSNKLRKMLPVLEDSEDLASFLQEKLRGLIKI